MSKLWYLIFVSLSLLAPPIEVRKYEKQNPETVRRNVKFLSVSSDSALIPYQISPEEYAYTESQLFTYHQLADIRKKQITKLKKKLKDTDGKKKRKRIRIKVKKKKQP